MSYLKTKWYKKDELENLYPHLTMGCRLQFERKEYFHWAIYVGLKMDDSDTSKHDEYRDNIDQRERDNDNADQQDGRKMKHQIIHRWLPLHYDKEQLLWDSIKGVCSTIMIGSICMSTIEDTVGEYEVRINNEMDAIHLPKNPLEIVAIAEKLKNHHIQKPYNLLTCNCEHFANQCRYGIMKSEQAKLLVTNLATTAAGTTASVVLTFVAPATNFIKGIGYVLPLIPNVVNRVQYHRYKTK